MSVVSGSVVCFSAVGAGSIRYRGHKRVKRIAKQVSWPVWIEREFPGLNQSSSGTLVGAKMLSVTGLDTFFLRQFFEPRLGVYLSGKT